MREDRASTTALLVQQGLLYTATRWSTAHLVSPDSRDTAIRMLSRIDTGRRLLRQLEGASRLQVAAKERLLVPGICAHHAIRKRWIEEHARAAIDSGARQVLNLGAGFDSLAVRLARQHPDLTLIEVDHPATQAVKIEALRGESGSDHVELLPVDFTTQTLTERLADSEHFDSTLPSFVVCEGVLPYLDEGEARELFRSLRALLPDGTQFAFTFLGRSSPTGRQPFGPLLRLFLTVSGESMKLRCEPEELRALIEEEGFTLSEVALGPDLLRRYGATHHRGPIHDLEMLALAVSHA
ncbi:MAG: SAM-dependent methyltransferase [Myxococcales bacterium]|nr:SAM-dependent methyltransferase [Myxococcales bacterium]